MKFGVREAAFALLLIVIPLGAWWFVFHPNDLLSAEMRKQIDAKQLKLRQLNRVTATVGDLKSEIASLKKAVIFFQSKLPNEKEIDKVLREVWNIAEESRLTTKSIRALKNRNYNTSSTPPGPHSEQAIAMKLEGDFMGLYGFLQALENQPRIMRIHSLKLVHPDKADPGAVTADITMSIFFENNGTKL